MAKKIVRGITDVKTINNQDFDTNNVNDLLSDGQYNYIHRKKGKTEEYHNLTDNIKTISSDNTELLSVTNNNKTTNTATLHPKHDSQKEQVLESTRNTISIHHGTNGTAEKTKIDVNTQKVLTHNNLLSSSPLLTIEHQDNTDTTSIKAAKLEQQYNYVERQKQNTENYYICMGDVSGTMTLTKLDNDIVLPFVTVKAILEYSIYLYYDASSQATVEKIITGTIKNIADGGNGEPGIYTDVTNPTIFSGLYDLYSTGGVMSPKHDSGAFTFYLHGDSLSVDCDTTKAPAGHVYNITGKTLLVEKIETGGGGDVPPSS